MYFNTENLYCKSSTNRTDTACTALTQKPPADKMKPTGEMIPKPRKSFKKGGNKMKKRLVSVMMVSAMAASLMGGASTVFAEEGDLIKVGIINNDPNESGYRTANDKDMKEMFTEENGYEASFAYSLKNDEQINAAQKFIQDEVDYLLLSAADTAGWDSVLMDAQNAGIRVILFDRTIDADESLYEEKGRTGALDAAVEENENWNIVTQQTAEWNAEKAQQIVQSVIDSGEEFNVIYAENDDMAKGAVAALDKANISHGVDGDVIIMGFDCNKWALEELLAGNWNYDGQCNPFQASYIDEVIKTIESGGEVEEKVIILDEKGFDAETITQEDVDTYGI